MTGDEENATIQFQIQPPATATATHQCPICERRFESKSGLRQHIPIVHPNSGLSCPEPGCNRVGTFLSSEDVASHLRKCHNFKCPDNGGQKCKMIYKNKVSFISHLFSCHEEARGETWLTCPLCKLTTYSLKGHLASNHGDWDGNKAAANRSRTTAKCPQCDKVLRASSLKTHLALKHSSDGGGRPFLCDKCDKTFILKCHLTTHSKKEHPLEGAPPPPRFPCPMCPATFKIKAYMKDHLMTHSGEKPYKCEDCGKSFGYGSALRVHRARMHPSPGTASIPCPHCDVCCRNIHVLRDHIKWNHGAYLKKKFHCYFCPKQSPSLPILSKHMAAHTRELGYKCGICSKKFLSPSTLICHRQRHEGLRKHPCYFCQKSWITRNELNDHMVVHTGEKVRGRHAAGLRQKLEMYAKLRN